MLNSRWRYKKLRETSNLKESRKKFVQMRFQLHESKKKNLFSCYAQENSFEMYERRSDENFFNIFSCRNFHQIEIVWGTTSFLCFRHHFEILLNGEVEKMEPIFIRAQANEVEI
jgi:hypothetical protein